MRLARYLATCPRSFANGEKCPGEVQARKYGIAFHDFTVGTDGLLYGSGDGLEWSDESEPDWSFTCDKGHGLLRSEVIVEEAAV